MNLLFYLETRLGNTRDSRKGCIVDECNKLRQALQHLLDRYEESMGKTSYGAEVDRAMVHVGNSTKDLKRYILKRKRSRFVQTPPSCSSRSCQ